MEAGVRDRVVLDPVYGYIRIPRRLADLVDHPLIQRLRHVSQTSLMASVFPSSTGTRFDHALGVMHLAGLAWDAAWANSTARHSELVRLMKAALAEPLGGDQDYFFLARDAISCVGLLHDVGHPPFSHALEGLYPKPLGGVYHEEVGQALLTDLLPSIDDTNLRQLVNLIYIAERRKPSQQQDGWAAALHEIVAGELDVDRVDYLIRDAARAGTEYGAIDYRRLIDALEIHKVDNEYRVGPGVRARSAAEMLLLQRTLAFRWTYHHPRVVAADLFLLRAASTLQKLGRMNEALAVGDHLVQVGELFAHVSPEWNYLEPSIESAERFIGVSGVSATTIDPQKPLPLEGTPTVVGLSGQPLGLLKSFITSSFDDVALLASFRRAYALAKVVLSHEHFLERSMIEDYCRYFEAAFQRKKNFLPVWKNHEEYTDVAQRLVVAPDGESSAGPQLLESLNAAIGEAIQQARAAGIDHDLLEAGEKELRGGVSTMSKTPTKLLNHLGYWMSRSSQEFLDGFNAVASTAGARSQLEGLWEATYRDFLPIRGARQVSVLFKDQAPHTVALVETSPVVHSLRAAEDNRMKFFMFFFLTRGGTIDARPPALLRRDLRDKFVITFPEIARRIMTDVYRARILAIAARSTVAPDENERNDDS